MSSRPRRSLRVRRKRDVSTEEKTDDSPPGEEMKMVDASASSDSEDSGSSSSSSSSAGDSDVNDDSSSDEGSSSSEDEKQERVARPNADPDMMLYAYLAATKMPVGTVVQEFISLYQNDALTACRQLANLLIRFVGSGYVLRADDTRNGREFLGDLEQHSMNTASDYPAISKKATASRLRGRLLAFLSKLIADAQKDVLFDGRLTETLLDWLAILQTSGLFSFRHTAVVVFAQLMDAMLDVASSLRALLDMRKTQSDTATAAAEADDTPAKQRRAAQLAIEVTEAESKLQQSQDIVNDLVGNVFVHRYRDTHAHLRVLCMEMLSVWMGKYPAMFFRDEYLRYVGWSLSDKEAAVRTMALRVLLPLVKSMDPEVFKKLSGFIRRFKPRLNNMCQDVDPVTAATAINVMTALLRCGELTSRDGEYIPAYLWDKDLEVCCATAGFIYEDTFAPDQDSVTGGGRAHKKTLPEAVTRQKQPLNDAAEDILQMLMIYDTFCPAQEQKIIEPLDRDYSLGIEGADGVSIQAIKRMVRAFWHLLPCLRDWDAQLAFLMAHESGGQELKLSQSPSSARLTAGCALLLACAQTMVCASPAQDFPNGPVTREHCSDTLRAALTTSTTSRRKPLTQLVRVNVITGSSAGRVRKPDEDAPPGAGLPRVGSAFGDSDSLSHFHRFWALHLHELTRTFGNEPDKLRYLLRIVPLVDLEKVKDERKCTASLKQLTTMLRQSFLKTQESDLLLLQAQALAHLCDSCKSHPISNFAQKEVSTVSVSTNKQLTSCVDRLKGLKHGWWRAEDGAGDGSDSFRLQCRAVCRRQYYLLRCMDVDGLRFAEAHLALLTHCTETPESVAALSEVLSSLINTALLCMEWALVAVGSDAQHSDDEDEIKTVNTPRKKTPRKKSTSKRGRKPKKTPGRVTSSSQMSPAPTNLRVSTVSGEQAKYVQSLYNTITEACTSVFRGYPDGLDESFSVSKSKLDQARSNARRLGFGFNIPPKALCDVSFVALHYLLLFFPRDMDNAFHVSAQPVVWDIYHRYALRLFSGHAVFQEVLRRWWAESDDLEGALHAMNVRDRKRLLRDMQIRARLEAVRCALQLTRSNFIAYSPVLVNLLAHYDGRSRSSLLLRVGMKLLKRDSPDDGKVLMSVQLRALTRAWEWRTSGPGHAPLARFVEYPACAEEQGTVTLGYTADSFGERESADFEFFAMQHSRRREEDAFDLSKCRELARLMAQLHGIKPKYSLGWLVKSALDWAVSEPQQVADRTAFLSVCVRPFLGKLMPSHASWLVGYTAEVGRPLQGAGVRRSTARKNLRDFTQHLQKRAGKYRGVALTPAFVTPAVGTATAGSPLTSPLRTPRSPTKQGRKRPRTASPSAVSSSSSSSEDDASSSDADSVGEIKREALEMADQQRLAARQEAQRQRQARARRRQSIGDVHSDDDIGSSDDGSQGNSDDASAGGGSGGSGGGGGGVSSSGRRSGRLSGAKRSSPRRSSRSGGKRRKVL